MEILRLQTYLDIYFYYLVTEKIKTINSLFEHYILTFEKCNGSFQGFFKFRIVRDRKVCLVFPSETISKFVFFA